MDPLKRKSENAAKKIANHFNSIHNTIIGIIVILVFVSLPLAALIVGGMRINECPIQRMIPIWLLVVGVIGVAAFGCLILSLICRVWCCYDENSDNASYLAGYICVAGIVSLFYFAWMIAGSVWIFTAKPNVQTDDSTSSNYCHGSAFNFSYGLVIFQLSLGGLFACCCCCGCVISLCSKDSDSTSASASASASA